MRFLAVLFVLSHLMIVSIGCRCTCKSRSCNRVCPVQTCCVPVATCHCDYVESTASTDPAVTTNLPAISTTNSAVEEEKELAVPTPSEVERSSIDLSEPPVPNEFGPAPSLEPRPAVEGAGRFDEKSILQESKPPTIPINPLPNESAGFTLRL